MISCCPTLKQLGEHVVEFDVVNDYYEPRIKEARMELLQNTVYELQIDYVSIEKDLADRDAVAVFLNEQGACMKNRFIQAR